MTSKRASWNIQEPVHSTKRENGPSNWSTVTMDRRNDIRDPRRTYQKYFDITVHVYARCNPATISYDDLTAVSDTLTNLRRRMHLDACWYMQMGEGGLRRPIVSVPLPDASINEKDATVQNERKPKKKEKKEKRKKEHDIFTTFAEKPSRN